MKKHLLILLILILLSLACSLSAVDGAQVEPTPPIDVIATLVAEQLTQAASLPEGAAPTAGDSLTPAIAAPILSVVYSSSGNIWLWQPTGLRQLTFTGRDDTPQISSDGQVVAFRRAGELLAINADGSGERVLVSQAYLATYRDASWLSIAVRKYLFIPASHDLFFDLIGETEAYPAPVYDLHKVNADTPVPTQLQPLGAGGGDWVFSPDGKWMTLSAGEQIRLIKRDGSEYHAAHSFPFVSTYSEWTYFPQVVWLADSSGFYTVIPAAAALENPLEPARFYYVPLAGAAARLAEFVTVPVWEAFPYISPNGAQVLYLRRAGENQELHVIDASTADRFYTFAPSLGLLGWNPNSIEFVYYEDNPANTRLAQFESAGVPLADSAQFSMLTWIDADQYLYLSGSELRLRNARSGLTLNLATNVSSFSLADGR